MAQNLNQIEAALCLAAAEYLQTNETAILSDLSGLTNTAATDLADVVAPLVAKVPIIGTILENAIKADAPAVATAIATGESALIAELISFLQNEAAKLNPTPPPTPSA
jgi:hypothetical protein